MRIGKLGFFRSIAADCRGSVAVVFAIAVTGMLAVSGMALDYARAVNVQNKLQRDLDAAMLASGHAIAEDRDVVEVVKSHFSANYKAIDGVATPHIEVNKLEDGSVQGIVTTMLDASLAKMMGFENIPLKVESEIGVATQNVEVALVVDNTASMSGAKLDALKKAAEDLVATAFKAKNAKDFVKFSVVPFARYVNVGLENRNMSWISVASDTSKEVTSCSMQKPITGKTNCRMETFTAYNDGTPYTYQVEICDYVYGPEAEVCNTYTETNKWHGCVGSRSYPLNTLDERYTTPIPGIQNVTCNSPVLPLTNEESNVRAAIANMVAVGDTYIPAGLIWGWRMLSTEAPFEEASAYGAMKNGQPVKKILILMTDGANTISPTQPSHNGSDSVEANTLTTELCTNIKAKKIELYSIAFDVTDPVIKDVLKACATPGHYYYDAGDTDELLTAFQNISKNLRALALSK